ncbi:MAG: hypothetical protein ACLFT0_15435 [Spirulinaceae cyanobacterium]
MATILLITLLNATVCLVLPRLLAINGSAAIVQIWQRQTPKPSEGLTLGESPSQS